MGIDSLIDTLTTNPHTVEHVLARVFVLQYDHAICFINNEWHEFKNSEWVPNNTVVLTQVVQLLQVHIAKQVLVRADHWNKKFCSTYQENGAFEKATILFQVMNRLTSNTEFVKAVVRRIVRIQMQNVN
jgi:hypothetical protein